MKSYRKLHMAAGISLLVLATITTRAQADPAVLYIKNPANVDVHLSLENNNSCYQGPVGDNIALIKANSEYTLRVGRNSAVDGCVGSIDLVFDPSPIGFYRQRIDIHGGGGISMVNVSNQYPGKYSTSGGKQLYTTLEVPEKKLPPYKWIALCSIGACRDIQITENISQEEISDEQRAYENQVSEKWHICIDAAGEGAVYKASVNACYDREGNRKTDVNLGNKLTRSTATSATHTVNMDEDWMKAHEVQTVWYYAELPNKGNGWTTQPPMTAEYDFARQRTSCPKGTKKPDYRDSEIPESDSCARK